CSCRICGRRSSRPSRCRWCCSAHSASDRKSTRLNSSHANIPYAVFCLKKKLNLPIEQTTYVILLPRPLVLTDRLKRSPCASVSRQKFFFLIVGGPPGSDPFPLHAALGN